MTMCCLRGELAYPNPCPEHPWYQPMTVDLGQLSALAHQQGHFDGTLERLVAWERQPRFDDPAEIRARLAELQQRCSHAH